MSTEEQEDFGDTLSDSPIYSSEPEDHKICPSCQERMKQPMVLSCLHVFCLSCLEKQVSCKIFALLYYEPGNVIPFNDFFFISSFVQTIQLRW